ncbi:MAG: hypothetical protein KDJ52_00145 [Anaerolineae bacterium]|nr:hypothetical protein [Anaerolineae bacterium]
MFRDALLQKQQNLANKQDKFFEVEAVIVEVAGSIWFDQSKRLVWVQNLGETGQPYPAYNRQVKSQAGVPVQVRAKDNASYPIVVDIADSVVATVVSALLADHHTDHELGGSDMMWLYPEALTPLATYPGDGLTVNVIGGYYERNGVWQKFSGATGINLVSSQPSSGNHRLVGLYLDENGDLQTINGTAVADGTEADDPTWPASAIPLSVVDLDGDQTSFNLAADIFNRRAFVTKGLSDHGALGGLGDDDHPQYHNDARGDARYYTQSAVDTALDAKSNIGHDHDDRYYTEVEIDAIVAGIESGGDADTVDGLHGAQFLRSDTSDSMTGDLDVSGDVISGKGSGGVALTVNDGKGNANVTFNHDHGKPEQNGNAARIEVNTDSTSGAYFSFELKSNVVANVSVDLTQVATLTESGLYVIGDAYSYGYNLMCMGAKAKRTSDQSLGSSTWTTISFQTAEFEAVDWVDWDNNTALYPKMEGLYLLVGNIQMTTSSILGDKLIRFLKKNTALNTQVRVVEADNNTDLSLVGVEYLGVNDYIQMQAFSSLGGTIKANYTKLSLIYLGNTLNNGIISV